MINFLANDFKLLHQLELIQLQLLLSFSVWEGVKDFNVKRLRQSIHEVQVNPILNLQRVIACMRDRILKECGAGQNRQSYVCTSIVLEDSVHLWLFLGRCIQLFSSNYVSWRVSEINFEAIDWWDTGPPNHNTACYLDDTITLGLARCIIAWCRSASAKPRIGEATYLHAARVGRQRMRL